MKERHRASWIAHILAVICLACIAARLWVPVPAAAGDASALSSVWDDWFEFVFLVFLLATVLVGWFLAWRRPRTALGWMVLAVPLLFVILEPLFLLGHALIPTHPTVAAWLLIIGGNTDANVFWVPPVGLLLSQIPLRFPTGSLPSRRWRWFFWYTVAAIVLATVLGSTLGAEVGHGLVNPVYVAWGDAENAILFVIFGLLLLPSIAGSLASLFVRYHRADTLERTQVRWVFWAAALAIGLLLVSWIISFFLPHDSPYGRIDDALSAFAGLGYVLIPMAIFVAVMRFGLYGIDRIISRTVSYTIVVLVVAALYAGIVVGLSSLIPNLPSVGVALATLAAAGVFLPLLRWVQRRIDRYFNRAAYDAQQVVEAFGQRLRDGADPHTATADLLTAIDQTLQPSTLGVWTR
jgi:hypothetical protein